MVISRRRALALMGLGLGALPSFARGSTPTPWGFVGPVTLTAGLPKGSPWQTVVARGKITGPAGKPCLVKLYPAPIGQYPEVACTGMTIFIPRSGEFDFTIRADTR